MGGPGGGLTEGWFYIGGDNCSIVSNVRTDGNPAQGTIWAPGTYTVTYLATDGAGLTADCSFEVTVTDNQNPELLCPSNTVLADSDDGLCSWESDAQVAPSVDTDNCPYTLTHEITGATTVAAGTAGSAGGPSGTRLGRGGAHG